MNSASSCFSVSAVAFGAAEMAGREIGRTMVATRKATARKVRNDFMLPPGICGAYSTPTRLQWFARLKNKAQPQRSLRVRRGRREMRRETKSGEQQKHSRSFVTLAAIAMKSSLRFLLVLLALGIAVPETICSQTSNPPDQATAQEKHLRN